MNIFNLRNVIDKPTRVTNHCSTLLDPIIISDSVKYIYADVFEIPSDVSDHDATVIFLESSKSTSR